MLHILKFLFLPCFLCAFPFNRQPSDPFITGDGFRAHCDHLFDETNGFYLDPYAVKDGDVVFVKSNKLKEFFQSIHPKIQGSYLIVSHNSDDSAPGPYGHYLDEDKILAWFALNVENFTHPKLHLIPIGIANAEWIHGDTKVLFNTMKKTHEKKHLLYSNFTLHTYPLERGQVYLLLGRAPYCYRSSFKSHPAFLEDIASSKFVLCPRGNGLDTHRLWETLYLGAYPIVKTSSLDPLYAGLPVVVVNDWSEVTKEFLEKKYEELSQQTFSIEPLQMAYWARQIHLAKRKIYPR